MGVSEQYTKESEGVSISLRAVTVGYGQVAVLRDLAYEIPAGRFVGFMGVNGVGKSTLLRTMMGVLMPLGGEIEYGSDEGTLARLGSTTLVMPPQLECSDRLRIPSLLARSGIRLIDDGHLFLQMPVIDNLRFAYRVNGGDQMVSREALVCELQVRFKELQFLWEKFMDRRGKILIRKAAELSGGERRILAVLCGLIARPKVILFDEPSMGMARPVVEQLFRLVQSWRERPNRPTILIADQFEHMLRQSVDDAVRIESQSE